MDTNQPKTDASIPALLLLQKHTPQQIADAIEVLIDLFDSFGSDPDLEDNGDLEPGGDLADLTYTEWHTRGRHKLANGQSECGPTAYGHAHEDAEDGDPQEDDGDEADGNHSEDDFADFEEFGNGPGCIVSDDDREDGSYSTTTHGVDQTGQRFANECDAVDTLETVPIRIRRPILRLKLVPND